MVFSLIDTDAVRGFFTSWCGIVLALIVAYNVFEQVWVQVAMRRLNCVKPLSDLDGYFGFKLIFILLKHKREGTLLDFRREEIEHTVTFRVAGTPVVVTKSPENIKALLATQFNDFALGSRHAQFLPLLGDGIFTLDGTGWKHSRAMLRPQFSRDQVAHVKSLEPHVQMLARHVRKTNNQPFDIQALFFRFTMDSATEFLFGESVDSLRDESIGMAQEANNFDGKHEFAGAFNKSLIYLSIRALAQQAYFLVDNSEFRRANAKVHKFADYYVQRALNFSPDELEKRSADGYIFLYELAKQSREPKVLRDQLLNILLAGRDTTASLLSFTFFELSRNPDVWQKLCDEIETRFGRGEDANLDEITFESLKKCEYLKAVLNEALRMYPAVPQNFRMALKDTTLPTGGGPNYDQPIFIRKGQTVAYLIYALQRDPRYYGEDAEDFRPERWFEPETRKLGWAFLPFNGGPRICLGQQFALTEASYVVTRLVQMFSNLKSFETEYPPRKASHLTMCHQSEVNISLS